jgi:hypothetical protein
MVWMKVSPRLAVVVTVFAVSGLGAYIWFVIVPSAWCREELQARGRASAEMSEAFEVQLTPHPTLLPQSERETKDDY